MLGELDVAVATARRIDTGQAGLLRVNFVGSALLSIVPGIVQRFRRGRPEVEIELRERSTVDQLRALSAGVVDVGLVRPPVQTEHGPAHRGGDARAHGGRHPRPATRWRSCAGCPCAGWPPSRWCCFRAQQAPGFHDLLTSRLAATGTLAPRRPVRAGDADDHRAGRRRDRRLPGAGLGRRGWRSTGSPTAR